MYEDTTKALVEEVLAGFTATVFAYGATGAGKTFTMVGTPEQPGIMVQALNDLFQCLNDQSKTSKTKVSPRAKSDAKSDRMRRETRILERATSKMVE